MRFIALFLAFFCLSVAARPHKDPCVRAFRQCDWEFLGREGEIPIFPLGKADIPFTPQVVSKNSKVRIGVLNMNYLSPEFILGSGKILPIKKAGLTPTHFKPYALPKVMGSAVGHEVFQKGQLAIAMGRCVRVFFTHYQLFVGGNPPDVRNIVVNRKDFKCVVFRTRKD